MILKNSEKKENNRLEFTVESDSAEFAAAKVRAYSKNKNQINIPGFRKGKAPLAVVEGMYGPEVFYQDALDEIIQDAFTAGIEEGKINFIGAPAVVSADVSPERTAVYTFSVELYPEVELGQYKGLEIEKIPTDVTDEEVDNAIKAAQKQNARMIDVDDRAAQTGDTANIDYEGFLDVEKTQPFEGGKGENHPLELGSGSFVPGFEEQVAGMKVGEEKDINITFPENYHEELAGKDVVFTVKLNSISFPELPELDDEFAKDVSEYDTFEEYKSSIRKELEEKKADQAKSTARSAAVQKACENMKVEVPETMIRSHIESIIRNFAANYGIFDPKMDIQTLASMLGIDEDTMNTAIRPSAVNDAKVELLVKAVIDAENIEGTEDELNEYIEKISGQVGASADEIRQYFGMDYITDEFRKEKALEIIADSAVQVEGKPAKKKAAPKKKAAEKTEAEAEKTDEAPAKKTASKKKTAEKAEAEDKPAEKAAPKKKSASKKKTEEPEA